MLVLGAKNIKGKEKEFLFWRSCSLVEEAEKRINSDSPRHKVPNEGLEHREGVPMSD